MQYRTQNALQEVSNTNNFGSVSDSLGRLAATSECMAGEINIISTQNSEKNEPTGNLS